MNSFKTNKDMSMWPTHRGTQWCSKWPQFDLVDYNEVYFRDENLENKAYGLDDLPAANATLVGQFFAD